jgi:hypothetical protein
MNKLAPGLAGLVVLLSQSPAALALSSGWTPALNQLVPSISSNSSKPSELPANSATQTVQPSVQRNVQPSVSSTANDSSTRPSTDLVDAQPTDPAVARATPIAPAPAASVTSGIQPIPSNLGLEFDLSHPEQTNPASGNPRQNTAPAILPAPRQPAQIENARVEEARGGDFTLHDLFQGSSDSLVAIAVGNAEGTRRADGGRNKGFYGHTDPGNGVWNLGTFSYQHGAASAEEADAKQLDRLMQQAQVMQEKAAQKGLRMTLEEALNGIDLVNQAPKAVLDTVGYVDWLAEAYARGLNGADAILWARVQSFFDPTTQRWNAPGLGNTPERITHDQQRRMQAIASAIDAQSYHISADARLRPQPVGFHLPSWNLASRIVHKLAALFAFKA